MSYQTNFEINNFYIQSTGYIIYFTYGIRKSTEGRLCKEEIDMETTKQQKDKPALQNSIKIETISDRYREVYNE